MKKLLVFAHRGEAETFIKNQDRAENSKNQRTDLLVGKSEDILITGEGVLNALAKVSAQLVNQDYDHVINLGLCGGLNDDVHKDKIYFIRSVYAYLETKPLFESFSGDLESYHIDAPQVDLMTSFERVLDQQKAVELSIFAPLVDREAYGIAKAAKLHHIPFTAIKIISDMPYIQSSTNLCEEIKSKAIFYGQRLFNFYQTNLLDSPRKSREMLSPLYFEEISHNPQFHFTFSLSQRIKKQLHSMQLKLSDKYDNEESKKIIANIVDEVVNEFQNLHPKKRAKKLSDQLQVYLNPFETHLRAVMDSALLPLKQSHINYNIDFEQEKEGVQIAHWIQNNQQKNDLIESLKKLDISKIQKIQRGDIPNLPESSK